jgi:hypothetical protein
MLGDVTDLTARDCMAWYGTILLLLVQPGGGKGGVGGI